jgi:hypothetical protein
MPIQRYKVLPESALTDPDVLAVLGRASQRALKTKRPITPPPPSPPLTDEPPTLASKVLDPRTIYPESLLKDPRLLELWGQPKSIYKDPKTKRPRTIDPMRIFPESILGDPKALEVLAEAARNALKGIRQAKMPVQSDPVPRAKTPPVPAAKDTPPEIEIEEPSTPKSAYSTPKATTSLSSSFSILDEGYSPFIPVSPKDQRLVNKYFDALLTLVPQKYKSKARSVIPLLLKVIDYSKERDRSLALLNYILLDDGSKQPPGWMRKYLYALLKSKFNPNFFPESKRVYFIEEYYKDFKNAEPSSITKKETFQVGKKPVRRIVTKSLGGRQGRRKVQSVLVEDIFV